MGAAATRMDQLLKPLDRPLLSMLLMVLLLSVLIQYSASGQQLAGLLRHVLHIAVGLVVLLAVAHIPPPQLKRWVPGLFVLNLLAVVGVLYFGSGTGAQRWLVLGPFSLQPSELFKVTIPMTMAFILGTASLPPSPNRLALALLVLGVTAWVIALQPDLGTAILITLIGLAVITLAGISVKLIAGLVVLTGISLPFVWQYVLLEYQKERVRIFFDPTSDPLGSGYNIIQSKISVGSGGLFGKGWTHSTQAQFDFLPEHSTDFIFSIYAEEFGLIGVVVLVGLYLAIFLRLLRAIRSSRDIYYRLLVGGLGLSFLLHVVVNMSMTIGYAPVVGLPLPLMSVGGSALVSTLATFGMIMAIRAYLHQKLTD